MYLNTSGSKCQLNTKVQVTSEKTKERNAITNGNQRRRRIKVEKIMNKQKNMKKK